MAILKAHSALINVLGDENEERDAIIKNLCALLQYLIDELGGTVRVPKSVLMQPYQFKATPDGDYLVIETA